MTDKCPACGLTRHPFMWVERPFATLFNALFRVLSGGA